MMLIEWLSQMLTEYEFSQLRNHFRGKPLSIELQTTVEHYKQWYWLLKDIGEMDRLDFIQPSHLILDQIEQEMSNWELENAKA